MDEGVEVENRRNQEQIVDETSQKLEKALSDPLRAWILAQLNDAPAAAVDLAQRAGEPRNKINYHFRKLEEWGCIELIDEFQVRGTYKKIYRGTTRVLIDSDTWERMSLGSRSGICLKIFGESVERTQRALEAGTFDKRIDRVAANYKPRLDEEGWKSAVAILHRAHAEIEQLEADAIARTPSFADRKPVTISLYCYESPPRLP